MSGGFYIVLFYSLLLTTGVFLLYFLYKYFLKKAAGTMPSQRFLIMRELQKKPGERRIVYFFEVPDNKNVTISIHAVDGHSSMIVEENIPLLGLIRRETDLHSLPDGAYYLRITTDKQEISRRFDLP
jgi:hypothetical protein